MYVGFMVFVSVLSAKTETFQKWRRSFVSFESLHEYGFSVKLFLSNHSEWLGLDLWI